MKIIILRGNSGSGKTSLAKRIRDDIKEKYNDNIVIISQDTIRRDILNVRDKDDSKLLNNIILNIIKLSTKSGKNVILEGIFNKKYYENMFMTINELFKKEDIIPYYFDLPFEETVNRHIWRKEKDEFCIEELKKWWLEKDYLSCIEEEKINSDRRIEDLSKEIIGRIYE